MSNRKMRLTENHPSVGEQCPACHTCFVGGDFVTLVPLGPGDSPEEQEKARAGKAYTAVAACVHWDCAGGVEADPPITWIFTGPWCELDNFYHSPIEYKGKKYDTVEHAFQAAKTHDPEEAEAVRNARTPSEAKALGQTVSKRSDWETVRVPIMTELVRIKFRTHPALARKLLSSGDRQIIEGNTWGDQVWGVCDGVGLNYLGLILMQVRSELRREEEEEEGDE